MGDFFQNGVITTLQQLGPIDPDNLEQQLELICQTRPLALVLPCLFSELSRPAMPGIIAELSKIRYLREVVVSLGVADADQFREAVHYFSQLPQRVRVLWNDGPRIGKVKDFIREQGLYLGDPEKGLAAWMAYGYVLGNHEIRAVALHDCDIVTYRRILLDRLVFPVMNPNMDYVFCKGYYARVTDRLHGRVTRIFVTPLLRALQAMLGHTPFLLYLDSFRYPLSGEFCMSVETARINRIPSDWGLEVGTLAEMYRNYANRRICQVDLAIDYEHKHQETGVGSTGKGLMRMAKEIAGVIFHSLATDGVELPEAFFRTLKVSYLRAAQDTIRQYNDLCSVNGLFFDRHAEDSLAEHMADALSLAASEFLENPLGRPCIPNWNRVSRAIPGIYEMLRGEVEADHADVVLRPASEEQATRGEEGR